MIALTAANGHLGRLVVDDLLANGTPAADIVAVVRDAGKAADLATRGVTVRVADYADEAALTTALAGVERLLLISGSEVGRRVRQHLNVLAAARAAGVSLLVYTSILKADTSRVSLAVEHKATEEAIRASAVPFTMLRNGWYLENFAGNLPDMLARGSFVGSSAVGRISYATRADYAGAAAAVLTGPGHANRTYELGGDPAVTMDDVAQALTEAAGRPVAYQDLAPAAHSAALTAAGLPAPVVDLLVDIDRANRTGETFTDSGDLPRLLGRPTTPAVDGFRAMLKN